MLRRGGVACVLGVRVRGWAAGRLGVTVDALGRAGCVRFTPSDTRPPETAFEPVRVIDPTDGDEGVFGGGDAVGFLPAWGLACGAVGRLTG